MTQYHQDTIVTFPDGQTLGQSRALGLVEIFDDTGHRAALVVAETPFHPLDHRWPDQPGDVGSVQLLGMSIPVVDTVTGAARRGTGEVITGGAMPPRRLSDEFCQLVLHILSRPPAEISDELIGAEVALSVDTGRRSRLSAAHSACHLSGLALNAATARWFRKTVGIDSLGNPDLEDIALVSSVMSEEGFEDVYRLGRTARKAGVDTAALLATIPAITVAMQWRLDAWLASGATVTVTANGPGLGDRRAWSCDLPEGNALIPCGGTHPQRLQSIPATTLSVERAPGGDEMTVRGALGPRKPGSDESDLSLATPFGATHGQR